MPRKPLPSFFMIVFAAALFPLHSAAADSRPAALRLILRAERAQASASYARAAARYEAVHRVPAANKNSLSVRSSIRIIKLMLAIGHPERAVSESAFQAKRLSIRKKQKVLSHFVTKAARMISTRNAAWWSSEGCAEFVTAVPQAAGLKVTASCGN